MSAAAVPWPIVLMLVGGAMVLVVAGVVALDLSRRTPISRGPGGPRAQ